MRQPVPRGSRPSSGGPGLLLEISEETVDGAALPGVALDALTTTSAPTGFTWDSGVGVKSMIAPINNGAAGTGWTPASGNVTEEEMLAGGFTAREIRDHFHKAKRIARVEQLAA